MEDQNKILLTIGELAENAGVSVRTLQYYDKTGLLKSTYSEGGRRMYSRDDIFKLQQILFFKSFGFSLDDIKNKILKLESASDFEKIFTVQREILDAQIANLNKIRNTLDTIIFEVHRDGDVGLDKLMTIMYLMKQGNPYTFVLSYINSEQLKDISERFQTNEDKSMRFVEESQEIFAHLNTLHQKGADPAGQEGQLLAERWWKMVTEFTGGDQNLLKSLINAGKDINNWPDESKEFREAIENFLSAALNIYLDKNKINLSELEEN